MKPSKMILIICLLLKIPFAFSIGENKGSEKTKGSEVLIEGQRAEFEKVITSYNKIRTNRELLINSIAIKEDRKIFKDFLDKNNITKLLRVIRNNDKAYIAQGKSVIVFSIASILKGEMFLNDQKVNFSGGGMNEKILKYQRFFKVKKKFSLLSFFLKDAVASSPTAQLDMILMASLMKMTTDFEDRELCAFCEDENKDQMKKNFGKLMGKIDDMASKCESSRHIKHGDESEVGRFVYNLNEVQEYRPNVENDYETNEILKEKFKMLDSDEYRENFTCGQMAYLANKDEIHDKFRNLSNRGKNAIAGYIGSTSAGVQEDRQAFDKYIAEKCSAHARLMYCLATNSSYGKNIYNRSKGRDVYDRIIEGRDIEDSYQNHIIIK
jgi:ribosomal protein S17E